jgi:hypothetical protein
MVSLLKGSKLRQFSHERVRDYRPDTEHPREQVFFLTPGRRVAHGVDIRVAARELMLVRLHEPAEALLMRGLARFWRSLSNPIISTSWRRGDKIGKLLGGSVGQ